MIVIYCLKTLASVCASTPCEASTTNKDPSQEAKRPTNFI